MDVVAVQDDVGRLFGDRVLVAASVAQIDERGERGDRRGRRDVDAADVIAVRAGGRLSAGVLLAPDAKMVAIFDTSLGVTRTPEASWLTPTR